MSSVRSYVFLLMHAAAFFHVEVGPDAAVQHHSAKALHLQGAEQHGGNQPWAGEGFHQRQRRERGVEGEPLPPPHLLLWPSCSQSVPLTLNFNVCRLPVSPWRSQTADAHPFLPSSAVAALAAWTPRPRQPPAGPAAAPACRPAPRPPAHRGHMTAALTPQRIYCTIGIKVEHACFWTATMWSSGWMHLSVNHED